VYEYDIHTISSIMRIDTSKERISLVICDLQPDLLGSLKQEHQERLLLALVIVLDAARRHSWTIVYSGLKFPSGYQGVSEGHKLYGAFRKLNQTMGDQAVHWFLEGWPDSEILSTNHKVAPKSQDTIVWRSQHIPHELIDTLEEKGIQKVYVVGAKASGSVQITCQLAMDQGMEVCVVQECVQDDDQDKLQAMMTLIMPIFANVISMQEFMENVGGLESFSEESQQAWIQQLLLRKDTMSTIQKGTNPMFLASDCGRPGHGSRFIQLLQDRGNWQIYPTQIWYEDFVKGEFHCPLAKKVVDFCDEPEFSKISMYLSGREYLDEKDKVIEIAGHFMPKTYCMENGKWLNGNAPPTDEKEGATSAPWFIKEADKNLGGASITIVQKPSKILSNVNRDQRYVIQQHIRDPLLTDDGRKTHLKFYVFLICDEDGITWTLYTYKGALLSISPKPWCPTDLSHDTQVTIHRHPHPPEETDGWKQHWTTIYQKCKEGTAQVIEKAIRTGKLKGRSKKKQFEVFSVDWMPDQHYNIWMFEFNMSPAVAQQEFDDPSNRDWRRDYLMQHDEAMLREALAIVMPMEDGGEHVDMGQWDFAGKFVGNI
jgi:nicotinamidase-related amidase